MGKLHCPQNLRGCKYSLFYMALFLRAMVRNIYWESSLNCPNGTRKIYPPNRTLSVPPTQHRSHSEQCQLLANFTFVLSRSKFLRSKCSGTLDYNGENILHKLLADPNNFQKVDLLWRSISGLATTNWYLPFLTSFHTCVFVVSGMLKRRFT
jgi:hypothetical protein